MLTLIKNNGENFRRVGDEILDNITEALGKKDKGESLICGPSLHFPELSQNGLDVVNGEQVVTTVAAIQEAVSGQVEINFS